MFTIQKIENQDEIVSYLQKEHLNPSSDMQQFMGLYEGGRLCGIGSLSLCKTKVYLNLVHCKEDAQTLKLALAKALLNMADLRGIQTVYGNNPELFGLYTQLRFKKDEDAYILSLAGYVTAEHK